jgi:hypothetical protein
MHTGRKKEDFRHPIQREPSSEMPRDHWDYTSLDALLAVTGDWLRLSDLVAANCRQADDCFDALVTRAAAIALCDPVPEPELEPAAVEGWIALPQKDSLGQLVSGNRVSAEHQDREVG